jgi:hypothetical protein
METAMMLWAGERALDLDGDATARAHLAILVAVHAVFAPKLFSPRTYYIKADLPEKSFWAHVKERRRDAAFMRYRGVSVAIFDELVERAGPFLPAYAPRVGAGRQRAFEVHEVFGHGLRKARVAHVGRARLGAARTSGARDELCAHALTHRAVLVPFFALALRSPSSTSPLVILASRAAAGARLRASDQLQRHLRRLVCPERRGRRVGDVIRDARRRRLLRRRGGRADCALGELPAHARSRRARDARVTEHREGRSTAAAERRSSVEKMPAAGAAARFDAIMITGVSGEGGAASRGRRGGGMRHRRAPRGFTRLHAASPAGSRPHGIRK